MGGSIMATINASTSGVGGVITTADATGVLDLQTADVTRASVSSSGLKISRVDSSNEGGQIDLCRSSDNTSAWAIDVYGNTSTPSLRFVDNVAATSRASIDGSGNFAFNSGYGSVATAYGCRAWVNFNGTGTVAIRASGNVTSITDNGTGDYTVNFTTAMPDTSYATSVEGQGTNTSNLALGMSIMGTATGGAAFRAPTTSGFRFGTWTSNFSGQADSAIVMVSVFR